MGVRRLNLPGIVPLVVAQKGEKQLAKSGAPSSLHSNIIGRVYFSRLEGRDLPAIVCKFCSMWFHARHCSERAAATGCDPRSTPHPRSSTPHLATRPGSLATLSARVLHRTHHGMGGRSQAVSVCPGVSLPATPGAQESRQHDPSFLIPTGPGAGIATSWPSPRGLAGLPQMTI